VKVSAVFNRARISKLLTALLIGGLVPAFLPTPASAAPACILNTDYTRDTSTSPGSTILKFTKAGSCSFRNADAITSFEYLIVGGGGGGGAHVGGGGGGGGVLQGSSTMAGLGAVPITVGVGGDGAHANASGWVNTGSNGGNSSLNGVVAFGGGKGGIWQTYAPGYVNGSVGSAGGSGWSGNYGGGTTGQGRAGGTGFDVQPHAAGGGGGAGAVGGNGSQTSNGNGTGGRGGDGVTSSIVGASTFYGGGGGGGVHGNNNYAVYTGGAGGAGGGGAGSTHSGSYYVDPRQPANYGFSGTANTGGGGGGAGGGWTWVENKGGNGGSGIVVLKYLTSSTRVNEVDYAMSLTSSSYYADLTLTGSDSIQPSSSEAFSIEAWVRPTSTCSTRCTIYSREWQMRFTILNSKISFILYNSTGWGTWTELTTGTIPTNSWSHVAITRSGTAIKLFLNGFQIASYSQNYAPIASNASYRTHVGIVQGGYDPFVGAIDEVKVWKSDRSNNIVTDMHSSDETVSGLAAYWNFNEGTGRTAYNLAPGAISESDLALSSDAFWNSALISDSTTNGPYTVRTFYRTYLTGNDGWKVPSSIPRASIIIVGGGGSGGKGASSSSGPSGGGGGGGVTYLPSVSLNSNAITPVKIGQGGVGAVSLANDASSRNGQSSEVNYGSSATALGGGAGASFGSGFTPSGSGVGDNSVATGGGSSGFAYSGGGCDGFGGTAGVTSSGYNGGRGVWGWGGAGGGARGAATNGNCQNQQGVPGAGFVDPVTSLEYGRGGYSRYSTAAAATRFNVANSGFGGSVAYNDGQASGDGYNGMSGIVIIRWITASAPTYTKPTNANINVGMTETFSVNVATDSATAMLTRTFKWESSTAGAAGPFTVIKQGTGASNAFFSWVPTDTSTSGSNFLFRLTVTDSDTAGLFITDSSTAFALINGALSMTGSSVIRKSINTSKVETLTVTNGTPTYRYSLSPPISGITLDTSTVGFPRIRLAETVTVGTYLETLTVTDSVSATSSLLLTIVVSGAPTFSNSGDIVTTGQVFHLDSGNSASYTPGTSASSTTGVRDISGGGHTVTVNGSALAYSDDSGGTLALSAANSNFLQFTKRTTLTKWTIEAFVKIEAAPSGVSCVVTNQYTAVQINYALCIDAGLTWFSGFHNGAWTYKRAGTALPTGTWSHLVGTYDSSTAANGVQLYLNGALVTTISDSAVSGGATPPAGDTQNVYIARRWDANTFIPMTMGAIRIYDSALSLAQVQQNYNATRTRFLSENINQIKPAQKHNTTTVRNFTITSGGDTKTATFAVGNRTGVEWTTPDSATVRLTVKPDLVVGTFYDTITVTDNLSSSTILPVKITISKGDQAKLSFGQYNAFPGISSYPINVYGGSGGGTVTRSLVDSGTAGCVLTSSMFLTAARVGACSVRAVKATDTNWLTETATATIYWIQWSDAYATRAPSTPTEIVLNHSTAITKYNYDTLTVTSYQNSSGVTITSIAASSVIRIIGDGFDPTAAYTEVVFFNNSDALDLTSGLQVISSGGSNYLQLTVPSGAASGAITVNSPKGTAVGPTLTITP
jgi:hypothetical protein